MKLILLFLVFAIELFSQNHFNSPNKIVTKKVYPKETVVSGITPKVYFSPYGTNLIQNFALNKIIGLDSFRLKFELIGKEESLSLKVYKNKKLVQKFRIETHSFPLGKADFIEIADLNNDKLLDVKIILPNAGCGIAGELTTKIYLFQDSTHKFHKIEFFDFSIDKEVDLDNDSIYELVSTAHEFYGKHSYWVHNLYHYSNGKLINVSDQYGYPLWTRHLYHTRNKISLRIPEKIIEKSKLKFPNSSIY